MTAYQVFNKSGEEITSIPVDMETAKIIKARNRGNKIVAVEAPTFPYYRGTMIDIIEEVTNGYTLTNAMDGSFFSRRVITAEIEYR